MQGLPRLLTFSNRSLACNNFKLFFLTISWNNMAVSIGKRKRRGEENVSDDGSEDEATMRARFQRAFEARFKPLETAKRMPTKSEVEEVSDVDDDDGSDWSGLSEDENTVQVIGHEDATRDGQQLLRQEKRAFMVREWQCVLLRAYH